MSYRKPLVERERALEDAFFQKETKRLLEKLRAKKTRDEQIVALSSALGLDDPAVISPLIDAGLRPSNLTALIMAPLVSIAWADGNLDNEERRLIVNSEIALGVEPSSESAELVDVWLSHPPHPELLDAWTGCVHVLCAELSSDAANALRQDIVTRSKRISRAIEKSFLRGGGPTAEEKAVLSRIEAAFAEEGLQ